MSKRLHWNSNSITILRAIGMGTLVLTALFAPGILRVAPLFMGSHRKRPSRNTIWKTVGRLERRGYVTLSRKRNDTYLTLTNRGQRAYRDLAWELVEIPKPKQWDGVWRVVVFDIPETKRIARVVFQQTLRRLGFCAVQRSVYVFPYPCKKELFPMLREQNLEEYIEYFETRTLGTAEKRVATFYKKI